MNNEIGLKWNSVKYYHFNEDFMKEHKKETDNFIELWDEYWENSVSCFGASEHNKDKKELKRKICDSVCELYNLGCIVQNNWDDTYFETENEIRKYLEVE